MKYSDGSRDSIYRVQKSPPHPIPSNEPSSRPTTRPNRHKPKGPAVAAPWTLVCQPEGAKELHQDAGQLLIKLNPQILTTFDISEAVPKRCLLCGYIYVAALDELVHYDICLQWRKKIASLPAAQKATC